MYPKYTSVSETCLQMSQYKNVFKYLDTKMYSDVSIQKCIQISQYKNVLKYIKTKMYSNMY